MTDKTGMPPQDCQSAAEFNHPCKHSCSGWKQGHDVGAEFERARSEKLAAALERITNMDCPIYVSHPQSVWWKEHVVGPAREALQEWSGK